MENQVIFKTSLSGFNKREVLDYIDELTRSSKAAVTDLEKKMEDMQRENASYLQQQEEHLRQLNEMTQELQEKSSKESELNAMLSSLNEELQKQQGILREKEMVIAGQENRIQQLRQRSEALEEKNRKYDEAAGQIGQAILDAKAIAKKIVEQANDRAGLVSEKAKETVGYIFSDITAFQGEMDVLKKSVRDTFLSINEQIDHAQQGIDEVAKKYEAMIKADIIRGQEALQKMPEEAPADVQPDAQEDAAPQEAPEDPQAPHDTIYIAAQAAG